MSTVRELEHKWRSDPDDFYLYAKWKSEYRRAMPDEAEFDDKIFQLIKCAYRLTVLNKRHQSWIERHSGVRRYTVSNPRSGPSDRRYVKRIVDRIANEKSHMTVEGLKIIRFLRRRGIKALESLKHPYIEKIKALVPTIKEVDEGKSKEDSCLVEIESLFTLFRFKNERRRNKNKPSVNLL